MAEYGKNAQDGDTSKNSGQSGAPGMPTVTVPDSLVSEFLALHGVDAAPPGKTSTTKNAFMGAVVGANPLVGGMLHVANNQLQGSAQSEWLSWKQWALAHPDWPAFWEPHKERIAKEVTSRSESRTTENPRREIKYGDMGVVVSKGKPSRPLHQKPAGFAIAILAGSLGGPFGLIASPLLLWLCSNNGEKLIKGRSGAEHKVGVWAQWAGAGVIIAPILVGVTALIDTTTVTSPPPTPKPVEQMGTSTTFRPGVPGRSSSEVCNSSSKQCQYWTSLAKRCEENMRQRDAGYMGSFDRNYCSEMEAYRESITGVALSTDPGAYNF